VPSRRAVLVGDGVLAVALAVVLLVGTFLADQREPGSHPFDAGSAAIVAAAALVLAARRLYPVAVLALVFGIILLFRVLGYAEGPIWLTLVIAYGTAIVRGHRIAAVTAAVAGFGIFPWLGTLLGRDPAPSLVELVALAAWLLVIVGASEAVRIQRERAAEAARLEEEAALRRASDERLRIARDLHDSLGHYLSMISVQSGVALNLNHDLPDQVRDSLVAVRQASKEGLAELRSVLGILRQEGEPAPHVPLSTLARLDDLVSQAAAGGLDIRRETGGTARALPFRVDVTAFRIVQEALTNVRRHAGTATATVRVSYGERDLTVEVNDDGPGPAARQPSRSGSGIAGMRERAAAVGGQVQAGPRPGGGFRVRATLPLGSPR
jgi:signal transduction histidine kinase